MERDELAFAGAARQAELLREREVSAPELIELYAGRIEALEPRLNAFTRLLLDEARAEAQRAQERLDAGEQALLLGVPVAVKDNVDVAGEITSHGTAAAGAPAGGDAEVVRRLRAAGALIVGKTALPELAQWGHFTDTITFGTTRNPWDPQRSPGGSSGGSAVAVAAGLAAAALGSDGGASIRVPAGLCGLYGLKPQRGRVSLMPDAQHWHGLTMFGGLTRTVGDAGLFLDAVAGPAAGDAHAARPPKRSFLEAARTGPGRLRIALSTKPVLQPVRLHRELRRAVQETAQRLRELGHDVREQDPRYPFFLRAGLPRYLSGIADDADRLPSPDRLERRTRTMAGLGRRARRRELARALAREEPIGERVNAVFDDHDVLLTPLVASPAPGADRGRGRGALRTFFDMTPWVTYTAMWNYTGQPAAALPAGFDGEGMPMAVQLVGRPHDEETLLSLSGQLERARPWADRRPPLAG